MSTVTNLHDDKRQLCYPSSVTDVDGGKRLWRETSMATRVNGDRRQGLQNVNGDKDQW